MARGLHAAIASFARVFFSAPVAALTRSVSVDASSYCALALTSAYVVSSPAVAMTCFEYSIIAGKFLRDFAALARTVYAYGDLRSSVSERFAKSSAESSWLLLIALIAALMTYSHAFCWRN